MKAMNLGRWGQLYEAEERDGERERERETHWRASPAGLFLLPQGPPKLRVGT